MEILSKLFGSTIRVRVMRFFIFNPDVPVSAKEIAVRVRAPILAVEKELRLLLKIGLARVRPIIDTQIITRKGKKPLVKRRKVGGWTLDKLFPYLMSLQALLVNTVLIKNRDVVRRISRGGNIKMIVAAGVFLQEPESRLDLLVVGDHLKRGVIANAVRTMEAEIGKELRYSVLETPEYKYRASICDKLVRDVFDYPHQKLIDKLANEDN